jgi:undecaprenyl-diphosphatase
LHERIVLFGNSQSFVAGAWMIYLLYFFQIVLESLPVSSSGHIFLLLHILGTSSDYVYAGMWPAMEETAHAVTVGMLFVYFFSEIWNVIVSGRLYSVLYRYIPKIIIANGVTTILYGLFAWLHVGDRFPLWFGFTITMLILASSCMLQAKYSRNDTMTWQSSLVIGFVQGLALMPGISRLASTYMVARALGYSHAVSFRFTVALQVPLFAAGACKGALTLMRHHQLHLLYDMRLWLVAAVASVISYGLLWVTEDLFKHNRAWMFAIYLIIPLCFVLIS